MVRADAAINILRNRVSNFRNQGGTEEKTVHTRLEEIQKQKQSVFDSKIKTAKKNGYSSHVIPIKSKIGNFDAIFSGYSFGKTPEETKLYAKLNDLEKHRREKASLLLRKLDDITLKVNISGLDADTTQLLKDFLAELERIGG